VDADAPASVKDFLRRYYMRYSGPAGMTEQDDMENWLYATRASTGTIARRHAFNYQQSMRAVRTDHETVPGAVSTQPSEHMARGFYDAWAAYMRGDGWDGLMGRARSGGLRAAAE
jgi:hypothetical protein